MKRIGLAFGLVLITIGCCFGQSRNDFRGFRWGNSMEQVKKHESATFVQRTDTSMEFSTRTYGIDSKIIYMFARHKGLLYVTVYFNNIENANDLLSDFFMVEDDLSDTYGPPQETGTQQHTIQEDLRQSGSVAVIELERGFHFAASWQTKRTAAVLWIQQQKSGYSLELVLISTPYYKSLLGKQ